VRGANKPLNLTAFWLALAALLLAGTRQVTLNVRHHIAPSYGHQRIRLDRESEASHDLNRLLDEPVGGSSKGSGGA